MNASKRLKRRLVLTALVLLITLLVAVAATFAWYIYNTNSHTTNVRMAAGAGASLEISNTYNGSYGSAAVLDAFTGTLNPVSTDKISGGFQKVYGYTNGSENQSNLVANLFGASEATDYYSTTLYLRTSGDDLQVYLADIAYQDSDADNPISTAIRVGIVPHSDDDTEEYIFAINTASNPEAEYNTAKGKAGSVLNSAKSDGSTVEFTPYTSANYCNYNTETGEVTLKKNSVAICSLKGSEDGSEGEAVRVDVYIWLEGCDEDCTMNLCNTTLENLSLSFAGVAQ
jgi:hypothetical protein